MDWKTLFFSANGRIGKKDFWIGFLILLVAGFVLGLIPVLGMLIGLALIYCWVCLYAKRLHDFDKPAILLLIPFGVVIVAGVLAGVMGMGAMMAAGAAQNGMANAAAMGSLGLVFAILGLSGLINIAFVLWVGLTDGTPGDNRFGPPAVPLTSGATPPATTA